ncbi:nucleoside/nucleotide kinase family protein [Frondihabitans australicus]|uniref:nucleoside/nucleotide kinase family protein n=1 Tax=Frondihabitans australicus TaxID=386892 RepID=UPI001FE51E75|nr:nucleoside/nucleotide kinase family protein [Frondihabitans australicus]
MTSADPLPETTLDELVDRARGLAAKGGRRILGVVGTPGSGKSTVSAALLDALGDSAALVGMDGFHLGQQELARLARADRKGAPDTFDTDGYTALLARLRAQRPGDADIYAPVFDRSLEEPIGSSAPVPADVPLVITEGNYLLLDGGGWQGVRPLLDEAWFVHVTQAERRRRLVARRLSYGHPHGAAEHWVDHVDEPNARIVEATAARADLVVALARLDAQPHPLTSTSQGPTPTPQGDPR